MDQKQSTPSPETYESLRTFHHPWKKKSSTTQRWEFPNPNRNGRKILGTQPSHHITSHSHHHQHHVSKRKQKPNQPLGNYFWQRRLDTIIPHVGGAGHTVHICLLSISLSSSPPPPPFSENLRNPPTPPSHRNNKQTSASKSEKTNIPFSPSSPPFSLVTEFKASVLRPRYVCGISVRCDGVGSWWGVGGWDWNWGDG